MLLAGDTVVALPTRLSNTVTWTVLVAALLGAGVLVSGEWIALSGTLVFVCLAAILIGVISVAVWGWTEARGEGRGAAASRRTSASSWVTCTMGAL